MILLSLSGVAETLEELVEKLNEISSLDRKINSVVQKIEEELRKIANKLPETVGVEISEKINVRGDLRLIRSNGRLITRYISKVEAKIYNEEYYRGNIAIKIELYEFDLKVAEIELTKYVVPYTTAEIIGLNPEFFARVFRELAKIVNDRIENISRALEILVNALESIASVTIVDKI